ncbi:MAG TPA: ABC transporter permease, partial [Candidatus Acidoferrales bacterium]|nr:ABC transporter permease [Candidatus Acidoferrales bacterium]
GGFSYLDLQDVIAQDTDFSGMTGVSGHELTLTGRGDPFIVRVADVTAELFSVFEQQPILGRAFRPEDGKPGAANVVILGESVWRGVFAADPGVIGASINLDKRAYTIVGVMPSNFSFPLVSSAREIWIPVGQDPQFESWMNLRARHWLLTTGRLKAGVSIAEAQAELKAIGERLAKQFPSEDAGWEIDVMPLQKLLVGDARTPMLVLLGAVGLVLVIACANLANLLLTRATTRSQEVAIRIALGASRGRVVRQLLSETAILGILGGGAGTLLAYWGVGVLTALLPKSVPQPNPIRVDHVVLAFALGISLLAIILFGLVPAFLSAKSDPQQTLRESGARAGEGSAGRRARRIFAGAEIALATVLLVAAGLLIRSFSKLTSVNPGFETAHIVKANISLPRAQYRTPQQWLGFTGDLLARVQAEPGMRDAAWVVPTPLADRGITVPFQIVGRPATTGESRTGKYVAATPNYLHVMGIPLISGRFFTDDDVIASPRVAVISAAFARIYFPDENPIGNQISFSFPGNPEVARGIVGIAADIRDSSLGEDPKPMMYMPFAQVPFWGGDLVVNSSLPPATVISAIRRDVLAIDKDLPIGDISKMPEALSANVAEPKFRTELIGLFAAMAVVLAAIGIFGVISYSVSCRTREIGIRVAMGASRGGILRMVFRETLLLAAWGLALGIPAALAASRLVAHMLFAISPNDPFTIAAVASGLIAVAALAGYLPARRAMGVDPLVALRHE